MEGKGLIIRDWAPQVLILEHKSVGAFLSHCGWKSALEGISAGIPMITWPVIADHFFTEKLVLQIFGVGVGVGVGVGAEKWGSVVEGSLKNEAIEKAVTRIMEGDEAEELRNRVKVLEEMARAAEGGSSFSDLTVLIEELRTLSEA